MEFLKKHYRGAVRWAIEHRSMTVGGAVLGLAAAAVYLTVGGVIGSEFLPHLDEGALWVQGNIGTQHWTE